MGLGTEYAVTHEEHADVLVYVVRQGEHVIAADEDRAEAERQADDWQRRQAAGTRRTDQRKKFLTDILTTAVENGGVGWFYTLAYKWESVPLGDAYAIVQDMEDETLIRRVDLGIIARGLGVIRAAKPAVDQKYPDDGPVLHNAETGQRLYLSVDAQKKIGQCDRENEADLDAVDALAIVECGLFGRVVYS